MSTHPVYLSRDPETGDIHLVLPPNFPHGIQISMVRTDGDQFVITYTNANMHVLQTSPFFGDRALADVNPKTGGIDLRRQPSEPDQAGT